jgi:hypothetical protein
MVLVAAACGLTFFFKSAKGGEARISSKGNSGTQGRRPSKAEMQHREKMADKQHDFQLELLDKSIQAAEKGIQVNAGDMSVGPSPVIGSRTGDSRPPLHLVEPPADKKPSAAKSN